MTPLEGSRPFSIPWFLVSIPSVSLEPSQARFNRRWSYIAMLPLEGPFTLAGP